MRRLLVGLPLLAGLGACASAVTGPPALQADWLTVSGRHALPKAEASPFAGRIRVGEVRVDAAAAASLKLDPALYRSSLKAAVEKSLANYGWLGTGAEASAVNVNAAPPSLARTSTGTAVATELTFTPADPAFACLRADARAEFKALSPKRSGGGQRAMGWVAGVTLAALSGPAGAASIGQWMAQNGQDASFQNAAMNSRRETAWGEGVAPSFDKAAEARFGVTNATQLAIAGYLAHLASTCAS